MRNEKKGSAYLLLPGVIIVISFVLVAFFIRGKLAQSAGKIGGTVTSHVQGHKEFVYRSKFKELLGKVGLAKQIVKEEWLKGDNPHAFKSILFSDSMVNHIWYASKINGQSTFVTESRSSARLKTLMDLPAIRAKIQNALSRDSVYSSIEVRENSVHWIYGVKAAGTASDEALWLGFDIEMHELQKYMEEADEDGSAYAFIVDSNGIAIFNPEQKLIGKRVLSNTELKKVSALSAGKTMQDTVESFFLKVPVVRRYSSFNIGDQPWIFVVDAPTMLVDDEINAISRDSLLLGLLALVLILATGAYSQRKWLKEFGLRQRAEEEQQALLLEKQQLLLTAETQQKENVLLQLDKLKEKINPHFLFNSLGSLNALIGNDPETAKKFVLKLSKVYRYVLNGRPDSLSPVQDEIDFAEQYVFLLKVRFGEALQFRQAEIGEEYLQRRIPFMSIQTAIENAVKHNVVSVERPLIITLERHDQYLRVRNTLQARSTPAESGGHGLRYIESIYNYYKVSGFQYHAKSDEYTCSFPLI